MVIKTKSHKINKTTNKSGDKSSSLNSNKKGVKRSLIGKGPTPKAEDRVYHKAHQKKMEIEHKKNSNPKLARLKKEKEAAKKFKKQSQKIGGKTPLEVIYGRNSVLEALRARIPVSRIVFAINLEYDERIKEMMNIANELSLPLFESSRGELDAICKNKSHQGVLIQIPPFNYNDLTEVTKSDMILMLDHITDPSNLGSVVRSCAAFGANIVIPANRSADVNATVWKVSAGNLSHIKIAKVANLVSTIERLKKEHYFIVGLDGDGEYSISDKIVTDNQKIVFIAGNEGSGISRLVAQNCDVLAKIESTVESLNVAVASSIAMFSFRDGVN